MGKISKTVKILTFIILALEGAYLLGYVGVILGVAIAWLLLWLSQKISETKKVQIIFVVLAMTFAAVDYINVSGCNPVIKNGRGYSHCEFARLWTGAAETDNICGWNRVGFNFRHFFKWWFILPRAKTAGIKQLLTSDGNYIETNLIGHLGGSALLVLIALFLSGSVPTVVAAGTAINIFHEYVAEGRFCDPSFMDLWLDQIGILLAIAVYQTLRWTTLTLRKIKQAAR